MTTTPVSRNRHLDVQLGPRLFVDAHACQILRWALDTVAAERRRRDGAVPRGFEELRAAVAQVASYADAQQQQALVPRTSHAPSSVADSRLPGPGAAVRGVAREVLVDDPISTTEAGQILGLSARQASRLASSEAFGPIDRRGNRKILSRRAVHDYARTRQHT